MRTGEGWRFALLLLRVWRGKRRGVLPRYRGGNEMRPSARTVAYHNQRRGLRVLQQTGTLWTKERHVHGQE